MESKEWLHPQAIGSSMDSLGAALKSNIIPNKEYLLQGSIMDSSVEVLLHRLRGLCDNVDTGAETFYDQEMCFSIRGSSSSSSMPQLLYLRVRRALDSTMPQEMPCQLRYTGEPELGTGDKARPTIVRSSVDVAVTPSILEYLTELGARIEFEYVARGYMFRKGRMKITVSKIFKVSREGQGSRPEDLVSQSYLVEMSVLAPSGQDAIGEDMKAFAEQLKPLVHLDKIDYKRLPHTIP
ncbi:hypothetical protein PGB90_003217 [Kerria lacca]